MMAAIARIVIPVFFLGFSIAYIVSSRDLPFKATALPYTVIFFIILIGGSLLVRDIFHLVRARSETKERERAVGGSSGFSLLRPELCRPVLTLILLIVYTYVSRWVNFYVLSFLFLMAECVVIGMTRRQLPAVVVVMLVFTGFAYLFFELLLQIPL
jgi:hypothetical protein